MKKYLISFLFLSVILVSCDPENPNNPNDQEVITTVQINGVSSTDTIQFAFSDPDGPGGIIPTIDTIVLQASNSYTVSLELLDETKTPVDTVTNEIEEEGVDHQFFFTIAGANLSSTYGDVDLNGNPIGILNTWTTAGTSTGTLMITLKHQPGLKPASPGDITVGETDVEITFPVRVE